LSFFLGSLPECRLGRHAIAQLVLMIIKPYSDFSFDQGQKFTVRE
jgi:hypothetical protein